MDELRNDWLQVFSDKRVIFNYLKFVDAVGAWLAYIDFVDLFPEPIRVYLSLLYKEIPQSMAGDMYLQRFPPLYVLIVGQPRRVDANGFVGDAIGEPKNYGTVTIFCPTAREFQIRTVYDQFAPPDVQNVIIALGTQINACIDYANAHPIGADGNVNAAPAPTAQNAGANGTRKGGRTPTPDSEKEKYVNDWKIAQAQGETQESFCVRVGIGTSTLRAWMRELDAKQKGK